MKSERDWQDCPALEMRGIVYLGSLGSRLLGLRSPLGMTRSTSEMQP
ncbi:MAG TPA: hypothetical protein IGS37_12555 [Synechococcales cyanobacterium M55_K2018_004]|nr:hypothetical protein [Synechococcales cyanobacterium M55_K2018_004]